MKMKFWKNILAVMFLLFPSLVFAQNACNPDLGGYARIVAAIRVSEELTLDDVGCMVGGIVEILLLFAWIVTVIWIVYSGIQYSMAFGSPDKMESAKKSLLWAIIGFVVTFASYLIIRFVEQVRTI